MITININIINYILKDIAKFYDTNVPTDSFKVDIFFQKKTRLKRGKLKSKNITLWRKRQEPWTNFLAILAHELGHTIERKARAKIKKIVKENLAEKGYKASTKECEEIIGEAILRTLVPNGHLGVKYGLKDLRRIKADCPISTTSKVNTIKKLKSKIMPITKKILKNNENIFNRNYLKKISDAYYNIIK
jgi:hypothetical protein